MNAENNRHHVEQMLDDKPYLRKYLFARGFLLTDVAQNDSDYPFYGQWKHTEISGYHFYIHPLQTFYYFKSSNITYFLIGHAYNPFSMQINENELLKQMAEAPTKCERFHLLNELTGIFTVGWFESETLTIVSDCAGMQIAYYGIINGHLFVSTHMQLIGDLCALRHSDYVRRLTSYRFYHFYGAYLPGDLSSYEHIKRIVPNTAVIVRDGTFSIERFYPETPLNPQKTTTEYLRGIDFISDILHRSMELISRKWSHPAISLTGGMDSKCSLAAANGLYPHFQLFSYVSMSGEQIDADAAHTIAKAIKANHRIDYISNNDADFPDIEFFRLLLQHNFGNIGKPNPNDVRKRAFYTQDNHLTFDVEVKSWVSEIGRANYYKKFGFSKMPNQLSPRQMTTMYKFFLHNRKLVRETDQIFEDYIQTTHFDDIFNYDASDMFLWEMRYGGWGGQVITCEHRFAFDITIPYNNRLLMEAFLTLPLEKRISDQVHYDVIRNLNSKIDQTGITITNYNETKTRMYKEKMYYLVHTHFPF